MSRYRVNDLVIAIFGAACLSLAGAKDRESSDWWSLQPLMVTEVPGGEMENPIDRFIISKHKELGLSMASKADPRTLIRRLYFDLWGLPPSPDEIKAFEGNSDPSAYAALVDKLLLSPRYGERWARHWLDVVHYGETHGYDKDKPRSNAWPYRDYVVRAFNEDKPYARFIKEQLAGDILWPDTVDGIVATGFIAAGPWDFIGHAEVSEEKIDGKVARHLDRDDMVTTTMNTFTSLTVQCAQCHNHKRDPVTMKDYYSLQSVFAALDRADRPYDVGSEAAAKRAQLTVRRDSLQKQIAEQKKKIEALKSPELIALEKEIKSLEERIISKGKSGKGQRSLRYGYHSEVSAVQDTVKWVQVDFGAKKRIDHVVLVGADEYGFSDFGFPHRFRIEVADEPEFKDPRIITEETGSDYPRPGSKPVSFSGGGSVGRYVRLTATKLWSRRHKGQPESNDWIFAIGEMTVISEGKIAKVSQVNAFDSIESGDRWGKKNLIDGIYGAYPIESLVRSEKSKTNGYHSAFAQSADVVKWVQLDLGQNRSIDRVELYPARPTDFKDVPGFGFPIRFKLELSDKHNNQNAQMIVDQSTHDYPNPGEGSVVFEFEPKKGRYVRLSASKLHYPDGSGGPMLSLAEMRVYSDSSIVSRNVKVTSLDTINSGLWHQKNLVDGYTSRRRISNGVTEELLRLANTQEHELNKKLVPMKEKFRKMSLAALDPELIQKRDELTAAAAKVSSELKSLAKPQMVYAGTVHSGSGTFKGRGHTGGKPRDIFVLRRGSVTEPQDPVNPGTVPGIVPGAPIEFALPEDHKEGDRRVALAEWISHEGNTLTWRSIVNRVWQYHFGRGIVDTSNDFGRIGAEPTHPELLDWLAIQFRDGGGSIKNLHRLILNSATYKQVSAHNKKNAQVDNSNQYLWRQNRRRLEAEALRDTVLAVSGKMNLKMGGPSFKDFVIEKPQHSPHYQYHKYNPDDVSTHRRSIYRFIVRSQPQPFMDTFDCADPSHSVDKRGETTTALQALALLNNVFIVKMAQRFAERVSDEPDPVAKAFEIAVSRSPEAVELATLRSYAKKHGLSATCRIIFNLNEFSFID